MRLFDATTKPGRQPDSHGALSPARWRGTRGCDQSPSSTSEGTLAFFDAKTRGPIGFSRLKASQSVMAWNPAGTIIATGGNDGALQMMMRQTTHQLTDPITTGDISVVALAWDPVERSSPR